MPARNRNFNKKTFALVNKLYWNEGYDYADIAEHIKCSPPSVGRILRGIFVPIEDRLKKKKDKYSANYRAPQEEPKQAKTLRCKREELHSTKLNLEKAKELRKTYFSGKSTQTEIATKFNISQSTVTRIIQGENWKICKC